MKFTAAITESIYVPVKMITAKFSLHGPAMLIGYAKAAKNHFKEGNQ